jgi:hypothetical protein
MKNLAQRIEIAAKENRAVLDTRPEPSLILQGSQPVPVYMRPTINEDGRLVASFASSSNGTFFLGGLQWQWPAGTDNALIINFQFETNNTLPDITIQEIDCDAPIPLLYSPVGNDAVSQSCAVPPLPGTYRFFVKFSTGQRHDPQIVVTPQ